MTAVSQHLEKIAQHLCAGGSISKEDARQAGRALYKFIQTPSVARHSFLIQEVRRERNKILIDFALNHISPNKKRQRKAKDILRIFRDYQNKTWKQTRHSIECPHPDNTSNALCWRLLQCVDEIPGDRQIDGILKDAGL